MSAQDTMEPQKRTGLSLFAHVLITRLLTLIALNLLFCATALPVVTLPNSLAALYRCAGLALREEDFPLVKTFFGRLSAEFWKTLALGWLLLALLFGAIFGAVFYWSIEASFALPLAIFCAVLAVFLYAACCQLFYLLSRVQLSFGALIKNAFLLVFLQPLGKTVLCVASLAVLVVSAWFAPTSLPIIVLIACALSALLACMGVSEFIEKRIVSYRSLL